METRKDYQDAINRTQQELTLANLENEFNTSTINTRALATFDKQRARTLELQQDIFEIQKEFTGKIDNGALEMLQDFNARLKTIGATLIITFPSLTQSSYQLNATTIQKIHQRLLKNDFSIIGQPKDYVFENTLFYDTPYHLNGKGVLKRTHLLLEHLKSHHD